MQSLEENHKRQQQREEKKNSKILIEINSVYTFRQIVSIHCCYVKTQLFSHNDITKFNSINNIDIIIFMYVGRNGKNEK